MCRSEICIILVDVITINYDESCLRFIDVTHETLHEDVVYFSFLNTTIFYTTMNK